MTDAPPPTETETGDSGAASSKPDASAPNSSAPAPPPRPRGLFAVKEALTSIIIAFAMAFVFRGFVLEAFVIPTGSMAPTLLGQHHRLTGPQSGYSWTIGPWTGQGDVIVRDPMAGARVDAGSARGPNADLPRRAGDRIFVLKYLPPVYKPESSSTPRSLRRTTSSGWSGCRASRSR